MIPIPFSSCDAPDNVPDAIEEEVIRLEGRLLRGACACVCVKSDFLDRRQKRHQNRERDSWHDKKEEGEWKAAATRNR